MPDNQQLRHIKIEGYAQATEYVSTRRSGPRPIQNRNRAVHGNRIKDQLQAIKDEFEGLQGQDPPSDIMRDDVVYVEFISDFNFEPDFSSLQSDAKDPNYLILSIKKETVNEQERFRVNVMLTEGGISHFLEKVNQYLNQNVIRKGIDTGNPKSNALISNLETIQLATLRAFWNEPDQVPFPDENESVWWEVWFRKKEGTYINIERNKIADQLAAVDAQLGLSEINFPEHTIRLVRATAAQLSSSLFLLDSLAELRKPRETAEFFTNLNTTWTEDAVNELKSRIQNDVDENATAICLLDSGVQNKHPLLEDFLADENLFSYKLLDWGTHDGWPNHGHGTAMAGLALYGDLTPILASRETISLYHQLESVKIITTHDPNDPELYAAVTEEAVSIPAVAAPHRPRVYCMAVTDAEQSFFGRPSSWSSAVDKVTFGGEEGDKKLFLVSGGNIKINRPTEFPAKNHTEGVHDPGQAFNTLTVGTYTEKDVFDHQAFPGAAILSQKGGMAPSNSTSRLWENQWPVKPDIVMEGGNLLNQNGAIVEADSLQLLSTSKQYRTDLIQTFGDTSGAVALASRYAALLKSHYPEFWPETLRGLLVHSASWTRAMLNGASLSDLNQWKQPEKRDLLKSFGFGIPNLEKARYSASNALTLIAEEEISPFKKDAFNHIHYYQLPWPNEVLLDELAEVYVKLTITLSYYIEPNPGNRNYGTKFNYRSHSLRFNMIDRDERPERFQRRMNKLARGEDDREKYPGEDWLLGSQLHNKGSIHKDYWIGLGADLATRNLIAIRPGTGWYRSRTRLGKYDDIVRYSLIISIETDEVDVNIYTSVMNQVQIEINN